MYIPSNYTLEDCVRAGLIEDKVLPFIEDMYAQIKLLKEEVKRLERDVELTYEQSEFRRDLLAYVKDIVESNSRASDIKKDVAMAYENSYAEL